VTELAIIGLGSSLGDRERALRLAVQAIDALRGVQLVATSRIYRSLPMGPARGYFLNAAVAVRTRLPPRALLGALRRIEVRLGRRPSARWSDRALDLDLLLHGRRVRRGRGLNLPHPGLAVRAFALRPAVEVAPEAWHPVLGRTLAALPCPVEPGLRAVGVLPRALAARRPWRYFRPPAPRGAQATSSPSRARSQTMKFFLDTANLDEIREAHSWGIIDGVTTNPSLIAREGRDFVETIAQICEIVEGPVSAETVAMDAEGIIREGRLLAQVSPHVVVKVPLTIEGLKATRALSDDGIDVNVTLCFQPMQALMAAKAGAAYISPFLGRLDDIASDGVGLVEQIVAIYANYPELGTEVLAASIRHPHHMTAVALAGADVATLPFAPLKKMIKHPLTDSGLARFLKDWEGVPDNDVTAAVTRFLAKRDA
jgi:transaldolase